MGTTGSILVFCVSCLTVCEFELVRPAVTLFSSPSYSLFLFIECGFWNPMESGSGEDGDVGFVIGLAFVIFV